MGHWHILPPTPHESFLCVFIENNEKFSRLFISTSNKKQETCLVWVMDHNGAFLSKFSEMNLSGSSVLDLDPD